MEYQQQGISKKWQRHFRGTKTAVAVGLMVLGIVVIIPLTILWPQYYSATLFNSKLAYHLIIDIEDYFTCDKDYQSFVVNDPTEETDLLSIYLFNITNAADVFERGYKPSVSQIGPYGFRKYTYKYDVSFDTQNSLVISYKEYNVLVEVEDYTVCTRIYYRMDRAYVTLGSDPCADGKCDCQPYSSTVTVVNPVFLKLLTQESAFSIVSYFASDVFRVVKNLIEESFPSATRSHLVYIALQEIYIFRLQMQIGKLLNTSYETLLPIYSNSQMVNIINNYTSSFVQPSSCGLSIYGISSCPFFELSTLIYNRKTKESFNGTIHYPSVKPLLDPTLNISYLNTEYGLPKWIALCYYQGYVDLGFDGGYSTIYGTYLTELYNNITLELSQYTYNVSNSEINPNSAGALAGSQLIVDATIQYLANEYINFYTSILKKLVYEEFNSYAYPVPCDAYGRKCIWTWGYVRQTNPSQANHSLSTNMIYSLIDQLSKVDSNPNNIQYDGNAISLYNSYSFCSLYGGSYYYNTSNSQCFATNYSYTVSDATIGNPAGLWGIDHGDISGVNRTYLNQLFQSQPLHTRLYYFHMACNVSYLIHDYYRTITNFHDHFVVSYINKKKDSALTHIYSLSSPTVWQEIGWAQWGGGYITELMIGVKAVYQIKRDGMWYFGEESYYTILIEYSSWAITSGYPNAYINDVYTIRDILALLADSTSNGIEFRKFLTYISTTYIGTGDNYINGVGAVGDKTYTLEANTGNFSCATKPYASSCSELNTFISSSAQYCEEVQSYYTSCLTLGYQNNKFVTNCDRFETSLTAPLNGIICDETQVNGHKHNYTKSRGNIVSAMVYAYTNNLQLTNGLWCDSQSNCNYKQGGMFTTTTIPKLLFEGFTDPSVLAYLNLKYKSYLHFSCVSNSIDYCGDESFVCNDDGILLSLKNATSELITTTLLLKYGITSYDQYFTPEYKITSDGSFLWPYSLNTSIANDSIIALAVYNQFEALKSNQSDVDSGLAVAYQMEHSEYIPYYNYTIITVMNPIWATYPAWNVSASSNSIGLLAPGNSIAQYERIEFLKYLQCQKRIYSGNPDLFLSCVDELNTGRALVRDAIQIEKFHGNVTVQHFTSNTNNQQQIAVNGSIHSGKIYQFTPYLWDGFQTYPYSYQGKTSGPSYGVLSYPRYFDKFHTLSFEISQEELPYSYQRDITVSFPLVSSFSNQSTSTSSSSSSSSVARVSVAARRFTESTNTWNNLRGLGTPTDSYGMNYTIPVGMASLDRLSGIPLFIGTPHCYGNELWGGTEYSEVTGYNPDQYSQYLFVDYDPVTGRGLRNAIRQQLHLRYEASLLFPNAFQSQSRCNPPTRLFAAGTGYGCFTYIPFLWAEDANVMAYDDVAQFHTHYYTRPSRAYDLMVLGISLGIVLILFGSCLFLSEAYSKRKFNNRVYVD